VLVTSTKDTDSDPELPQGWWCPACQMKVWGLPPPTDRAGYGDWVRCPKCGAANACLRPAGAAPMHGAAPGLHTIPDGAVSICSACKGRIFWDLVIAEVRSSN